MDSLNQSDRTWLNEENERHFCTNFIKEGMTCFDIGACIGEYTLLLSKLVGSSGHVYAFEPEERNFMYLSKKVDQCTNVTLNRLALLDRSTKIPLNIYDKDYYSWHTVANRKITINQREIKPVDIKIVDTTTIDVYCGRRDIMGIDFLKIDVEGAELEVLLGCRNLLLEQKISCILFEVGDAIEEMGHSKDELFSYLARFGFRFFRAVANGRLIPEEDGPSLSYGNVVALKT